MSITAKKLLAYFTTDQLKDALRDIGEPLSRTRDELVNSLLITWTQYNRTTADLLDYLDEDQLATICYEYNLDDGGNENTLKRRIKKKLLNDNSTIIKSFQVEEKSSVFTRTNSNTNRKEKLQKSEKHINHDAHLRWAKIGAILTGIAIMVSVIIAFSTSNGPPANSISNGGQAIVNTGAGNIVISNSTIINKNSETKPSDTFDPYKMSELEYLYSGFQLNLKYTIHSPNVHDGLGGTLYDAFVENQNPIDTYSKTFWIVRQECDENGKVIDITDSIEKNYSLLLRKSEPTQGLQLAIPKIYPGFEMKRSFNLEFRAGGFPDQSVPLESRTQFKTTYIQFDYNNDTGSWNPRINEDFSLDCTLAPSRNSTITLDTLNNKQWAH